MISEDHTQRLSLQQYLDRIEYRDPVSATIETLIALHEAHLRSVPFENIDVQLGRELSTDIGAAFQKIVTAHRGGWCYEQNAVFGWALSNIGFDVTRVSAGVMRQKVGQASMANHLCLLVLVPGSEVRYLADVGFGGSMIVPILLSEAQHRQSPYKIGLAKTDDGYWRFSESTGDADFSFDFLDEPAREAELSEKCQLLQSDPSSSFVLNLVVQRRARDSHRVLRGRVFSVVRAGGAESRTLMSAGELVILLNEEFGLDVPEIADSWPRIVERHRDFFGKA